MLLLARLFVGDMGDPVRSGGDRASDTAFSSGTVLRVGLLDIGLVQAEQLTRPDAARKGLLDGRGEHPHRLLSEFHPGDGLGRRIDSRDPGEYVPRIGCLQVLSVHGDLVEMGSPKTSVCQDFMD